MLITRNHPRPGASLIQSSSDTPCWLNRVFSSLEESREHYQRDTKKRRPAEKLGWLPATANKVTRYRYSRQLEIRQKLYSVPYDERHGHEARHPRRRSS